MQVKQAQSTIIILPHEMSVDQQREHLQRLDQVQIPSQFYLEYFPEKNVFGIDDAKRLIASVYQKADHLTTHIIYTAHTMTAEAQNALLKTLEEPPSQARIALLTWKPLAIQQTIRSRCIMQTMIETNIQNTDALGPSFQELVELADKGDIGKALIQGETLTKDKSLTAQWCESLLSERSGISPVSTSSLRISHALIELLHHLNANVNTKLAVDRFFLNMMDL